MGAGNKEEAERAVTRGTGFTSALPPPDSTSRGERCPLVIGWIKKNGGGFLFCIMSGRASRACGVTRERGVPPVFVGGVGGSGVDPYQPRPALAVDLVKEINGFLKTVLISF